MKKNMIIVGIGKVKEGFGADSIVLEKNSWKGKENLQVAMYNRSSDSRIRGSIIKINSAEELEFIDLLIEGLKVFKKAGKKFFANSADNAADELTIEQKAAIKALVNAGFNATAALKMVTGSSADNIADEEQNSLTCNMCGFVAKDQRGLNIHKNACQKRYAKK